MAQNLKFAGYVTKAINANPRTGTVIGKVQSSTMVAGTLPKRSRGGGAADPLAGLDPEVKKAIQELGAPTVYFATGEGDELQRCTPVHDESGDALKFSVLNGEVSFTDKDGKSVSAEHVLFQNEAGDHFDISAVTPMEDMEHFTFEDSPEGLNRIDNAVKKYNKATGKHLRSLMVQNKYDDKGNIITQVREMWRVA